MGRCCRYRCSDHRGGDRRHLATLGRPGDSGLNEITRSFVVHVAYSPNTTDCDGTSPPATILLAKAIDQAVADATS